ncbi:ectoine hydroxylase [Hahella sp. CCB-MM4]|nr:ectoine hydroxylase [Hahella sp. CCB-MM4]
MIAGDKPYASRTGDETLIQKRQDPVVYVENNQIDRADQGEAQKSEQPALASEHALTSEHVLTPEQLESYRKNGFLMLDNVFTEDEVGPLRRELNQMRTDPLLRRRPESFNYVDDELHSVFGVHKLNPLFGKVARDARLTSIARQILADDIYIHQSRLCYKPGFTTEKFFWHSDFETWHVEDGMPRMRALSISIALTESHEHNGPLMMIPGSHDYYVRCSGDTPKDHYKQALKQQEHGIPDTAVLSTLMYDGGIQSACGKPGSIVVMDSNTLHGNNGNITPDPRANFFVAYNAWSNQLQTPNCEREPRPEYVAARKVGSPLA